MLRKDNLRSINVIIYIKQYCILSIIEKKIGFSVRNYYISFHPEATGKGKALNKSSPQSI